MPATVGVPFPSYGSRHCLHQHGAASSLRDVKRHSGPPVLLFAALIVMSSGCTGSTPRVASGPSASASAPSRSPSPSQDETGPDESGLSSRPPSTFSIAEPQAGPSAERVTTRTAFASPSGNILCFITESIATCRTEQQDWTVPPRPADCDTDWGPDIEVASATATATFRCASDAIPYDWEAKRRLAYGHVIRFRNMQCQSARSGMRCDNSGTTHGFTISRSDYDLR